MILLSSFFLWCSLGLSAGSCCRYSCWGWDPHDPWSLHFDLLWLLQWSQLLEREILMRDESHVSLEVIRIRVRVPFGEDNNFSPVYAFDLIVKYQMILETCTHIWVFCFVLFVYMSASVPIPNCIYYYSPIIYLEIWNGNSSNIFLFD